MEDAIIISGKDVKRYHQLQRRWWLGWVVALVMAGAAIGAWAYSMGNHKSMCELRGLHDQLIEDRAVLEKDTAALAVAWQEQHDAVQVVIAAADYLHERSKLVDYNKVSVGDTARSAR